MFCGDWEGVEFGLGAVFVGVAGREVAVHVAGGGLEVELFGVGAAALVEGPEEEAGGEEGKWDAEGDAEDCA